VLRGLGLLRVSLFGQDRRRTTPGNFEVFPHSSLSLRDLERNSYQVSTRGGSSYPLSACSSLQCGSGVAYPELSDAQELN
jgi:hypothetical protein